MQSSQRMQRRPPGYTVNTAIGGGSEVNMGREKESCKCLFRISVYVLSLYVRISQKSIAAHQTVALSA